jgi:hypothetical protein
VSPPTTGRDWHAWHREYADPSSSLSRRLEEVRIRLAALLEGGTGQVRLAADVRTGDASLPATWRDVLPVDVLMLCGVFGNITDTDMERTVAAARSMVAAGGAVVWTRGNRVPGDPTQHPDDPAERVRRVFLAAGFDEVAFVRPADASYRVGVARLTTPSTDPLPDRLFTFVR